MIQSPTLPRSLLVATWLAFASSVPTSSLARADSTAAPAAEPSACAGTAGPGPACECERGDLDACLDLNDATFQRGQHALAIMAAVALCRSDVADSCLQASGFLRQRRVRNQTGTTAVELRQRAVVLFEQHCAASSADACFAFGRRLISGKDVTADARRGIALVDRACSAGHGKACALLSTAYATGSGVRRDRKRSAWFLDRACTLGAAAACVTLGDRLVATDRRRALAAYDRACRDEYGIGCARSGPLHAGIGDPAAAARAWTVACDQHDAPSCVELAFVLDQGRGIEPDPARARGLFEAGCQRGIGRGCLGLASSYERGSGGARAWWDAVLRYRDACRLKVAAGCADARRMVRAPPAASCATVAACEQRCGEQIGAACTRLGELSPPEAEDLSCARAHEAYDRGCDSGDPVACLRSGNLSPLDDEAELAYSAACALGNADGCFLRDVLRAPHAPPAERRRLVPSLERACSAGNAAACTGIAASIVDRQPARARRLWAGSCQRGHGDACWQLAGDIAPIHGSGTSSDRLGRSDTEQAATARQHAEQVRWMSRGCEHGHRPSCDWLHTMADSDGQRRWQAQLDRIDARPCELGRR